VPLFTCVHIYMLGVDSCLTLSIYAPHPVIFDPCAVMVSRLFDNATMVETQPILTHTVESDGGFGFLTSKSQSMNLMLVTRGIFLMIESCGVVRCGAVR
jgi:hypothetical protein